jgi:uncharacterized phage protein (TIGR01671 family)
MIDCETGEIYESIAVSLKTDLSAGILSIHNQDRYVVEQYTGLLDKNGTKIFEGDIIEYPNNGKGVVYYDKDFACFNIKGFGRGCYDYPGIAFSEGTDTFKVIGNIHEGDKVMNILGQWARIKNDIIKIKEVKNDCLYGYDKYGYDMDVVDKVANTPQELIEENDLVRTNDTCTAMFSGKLLEVQKYFNLNNYTVAIYTPNSKGGYDLQWKGDL